MNYSSRARSLSNLGQYQPPGSSTSGLGGTNSPNAGNNPSRVTGKCFVCNHKVKGSMMRCGNRQCSMKTHAEVKCSAYTPRLKYEQNARRDGWYCSGDCFAIANRLIIPSATEQAQSSANYKSSQNQRQRTAKTPSPVVAPLKPIHQLQIGLARVDGLMEKRFKVFDKLLAEQELDVLCLTKTKLFDVHATVTMGAKAKTQTIDPKHRTPFERHYHFPQYELFYSEAQSDEAGVAIYARMHDQSTPMYEQVYNERLLIDPANPTFVAHSDTNRSRSISYAVLDLLLLRHVRLQCLVGCVLWERQCASELTWNMSAFGQIACTLASVVSCVLDISRASGLVLAGTFGCDYDDEQTKQLWEQFERQLSLRQLVTAATVYVDMTLFETQDRQNRRQGNILLERIESSLRSIMDKHESELIVQCCQRQNSHAFNRQLAEVFLANQDTPTAFLLGYKLGQAMSKNQQSMGKTEEKESPARSNTNIISRTTHNNSNKKLQSPLRMNGCRGNASSTSRSGLSSDLSVAGSSCSPDDACMTTTSSCQQLNDIANIGTVPLIDDSVGKVQIVDDEDFHSEYYDLLDPDNKEWKSFGTVNELDTQPGTFYMQQTELNSEMIERNVFGFPRKGNTLLQSAQLASASAQLSDDSFIRELQRLRTIAETSVDLSDTSPNESNIHQNDGPDNISFNQKEFYGMNSNMNSGRATPSLLRHTCNELQIEQKEEARSVSPFKRLSEMAISNVGVAVQQDKILRSKFVCSGPPKPMISDLVFAGPNDLLLTDTHNVTLEQLASVERKTSTKIDARHLVQIVAVKLI